MTDNSGIISRFERHRLRYAVLAALLVATPAGAQCLTPVGVWLHDNKRIEIEIAPCGDKLCGKLVWLKSPDDTQGQPLVDAKNPVATLQTRPLLGLTVLDSLHRTGECTWDGGNIYDPDDGAAYTASMSVLEDGALEVHAYLLVPVFGKSFIWTRMRSIGAAPQTGS